MPNNYEWLDENAARAFPLVRNTTVPDALLVDARIYLKDTQASATLTSLFREDSAATVTASDGEILTVTEFFDSGYGELRDADQSSRGFVQYNTTTTPVSLPRLSVQFSSECLTVLPNALRAIRVNGQVLTGDVRLVPGPGVNFDVTSDAITINVTGRPNIAAPTRAVRSLLLNTTGSLLGVSGSLSPTVYTPGTSANNVLCTSKANLPDADGNTPEDNAPDVCTEPPENNCGDNAAQETPQLAPLSFSPDSNGNINIGQSGRVRLDPLPDYLPGAAVIDRDVRPIQALKFGLRGQ